MKRRKTILLGFLLLFAIGTAYFLHRDPLISEHRIAWKNTALAHISNNLGNSSWFSSESNRLHGIAAQKPDDPSGWVSKNLIFMKNGDWLIFESISHKENPRIYDFFLAKGSDDQWYYSTYHFCKDNVVLQMEEQSGSLPEFVKYYSLQPFDGKSDECLKKTWPTTASITSSKN
jgi:hypothetical protein